MCHMHLLRSLQNQSCLRMELKERHNREFRRLFPNDEEHETGTEDPSDAARLKVVPDPERKVGQG